MAAKTPQAPAWRIAKQKKNLIIYKNCGVGKSAGAEELQRTARPRAQLKKSD
jgi:hypothetical protein